MKKVAIVLAGGIIGGVETSLSNMLKLIDYSQFDVTLYSNRDNNPCFELCPKTVTFIDLSQFEPKKLAIHYLYKWDLLHLFKICFAYLLSRLTNNIPKKANLLTKGFKISKEEYDCVIAYKQDRISICIALHQLCSKKKVLWMHGRYADYPNPSLEYVNWIRQFDHIFGVSESVVEQTRRTIPEVSEKISTFLNILEADDIKAKSEECYEDVKNEMPNTGAITLLSIGRFSKEKNFPFIPYLTKNLLDNGLEVTWYIIGYGEEEGLIRQSILENNVERHVIVLGKRTNPYPYIKRCDVYVQPSLHEGRSVAVIEAQILGKPVIITNYETAESQLHNGVDGLIIPMEKEACAEALDKILHDKELLQKVADGTKQFDYSNKDEIQKLYRIIEP